MTEPTPFGCDAAVEAALSSLTAVGDRERERLAPDTMAAIARAAAAERVGVDAGDRSTVLTGEPLLDIAPLTVAGSTAVAPRPLRGRSALGLVAALVIVVGIGAAILAAAPQPVVTQDGAAVGSPPAAERPSPDLERPVLDLTDLTSTTTVDADDAVDDAATGTDAGEAPLDTEVAETTSTVPPTSAAPSTTQGPTSTTGPATTPDQPSTEPPPSTPPASGDRLAIEVGVAATVELAFDDNQPTLGPIDLADDWSMEITEPRPGALGRRFTDGRSAATLEIWSEPGWFHLGVDHGDRWPSSTEWTRTITIDGAGTVDVSYGVHGLSGLEILTGGDWQHRVETIGPDHLLVTLESPAALYGRDIRVDAGRTTVDLRISGS